jgi:hypothetical protein
MNTIVIQVEGYNLFYVKKTFSNTSYMLEQVTDKDSKPIMMTFGMSGNGISASKNGFIGGNDYSGTMVEIGKTKMLVPYYLMFERKES